MPAKLLLVDDDRFLLDGTSRLLRAQGYDVETAECGAKALQSLEGRVPDLMVLDVSLPDFDGITLCRRIRTTHRFPILMLTARSDPMDKVIGLEVGADDYITKPFEASELVARVRAQLRRAQEYDAERVKSTVQIGQLVVDREAREVTFDAKRVELTNREFELLNHLASNLGRVLSKDSLFQHNWGFEIEFSSNSLEVHIYRLRKKIEPNPDHPQYIHTIKGYGYKLEYTLRE
jgi:DNA-binding response OmpR family regulator